MCAPREDTDPRNGTRRLGFLAELNRLRGEAIGLFGFLAALALKWDDFRVLLDSEPAEFVFALTLAFWAGIRFYSICRAGLREQEWLAT